MNLPTSEKTLTIQLAYRDNPEPGVVTGPLLRVFLGEKQIGSISKLTLKASTQKPIPEVSIDFCDVDMSTYGQLPPDMLAHIEQAATSLKEYIGVQATTPRTRAPDPIRAPDPFEPKDCG